MKTLTNKLVLSVLALVLTGVALSVGVFAWFTVNNTASVESFTGTVQTGEGFYVSLDGQNWVNTISSAEIQAKINGGNGVTFQALTSTNGKALTTLDNNPAGSGTYIDFDLYFVGDGTLGNVEIMSLVLNSGTGTTWQPLVDVPFTRTDGNANAILTEYASNAARVSFTDLIVEPTNAVIFEQNTTTNSNSLGKGSFTSPGVDADNEAVLYYNHFMGTALTNGQFTAAHPYSTTVAGSQNVDVAGLHTQATASTFIGGIAGWNVPASVTNVIGASTYKIGALKVRVWIEGWDQEALNAILSGTLDVTLGFAGAI